MKATAKHVYLWVIETQVQKAGEADITSLTALVRYGPIENSRKTKYVQPMQGCKPGTAYFEEKRRTHLNAI
ncbi:hypothetical protein AGOR_G00128010 [Albula goreensis]|uniref:Uncharacterized protein n=1 Tax=Albula goreensis TaxID=1534307 RepID=A0A8T3DCF7_9TELE|nr:hypothetical protein AGOR_G00128010 [Albula goreensis]